MELNDQAEADVLEAGQGSVSETSESLQDVESPETGDAQNAEKQEQAEQQPEQDSGIDERIDEVNSQDDWHTLVDDLSNAKGEPEPVPEPNDDESNSATPEAEADEEPGTEENADEESESVEPEALKDESEADEEPGTEDGELDPEETEQPTSKRYRLRTEDPVEQRALDLRRNNRDMSLQEALDRAKAELGDDDATGEDADAEEDSLPETVEATEREVEKLLNERNNALHEDLDFEKVTQLDQEIRKLDQHIGDLKLRAVQDQAKSEAEFRDNLEASKVKAVELYPFVTKEGVETARMEEIDATLKESNDPLYSDPNKPLILAQMVAKEMHIPPKGKTVKKPTAPAKGNPPKKKAPIQQASATAQTQPKNNEGQLDERIDAINSPMDFEDAMAELQQ